METEESTISSSPYLNIYNILTRNQFVVEAVICVDDAPLHPPIRCRPIRFANYSAGSRWRMCRAETYSNAKATSSIR